MKKKVFIILFVIILIILLFPTPLYLNDGGSIEFKALLYSVTKYHKLSSNYNEPYIEGIRIEILRMEIYNNIKNKENKVVDNEDVVDGNTYSFFATVIESSAKYILVKPEEGSQELKSSDKISIGLEENNDMIYPVGTKVKITYDGMIMESYPAMINASNIEVIL